MNRTSAAVSKCLVGTLLLAALPGVVCTQAGAQAAERTEPAAAASEDKRPRARMPKARRKPVTQARPAASASIAQLEAADLAKRTASELEALIARQRDVVRQSPRDEAARRNLGLLSVEAANRVLDAQSMGRTQELSAYVSLIRNSLADTLWRVNQLAREFPVRAQAALGLYYAEGILLPADPVRGCEFFQRAADSGHVAAAYRASQCHRISEPARAQQWLEQSARGGNPAAQETLGRACIEGASLDAACAKKWLEPAAATGRVSAMSVLAWLYAREATPATMARAADLYRAAAGAGDPAAQNNLGELYETGRGVARDTSQALVWYRKSAEGGFGPAQFNLGRLLAFGIGTERDSAAARVWAAKAQDQGIAQAAELLKLIAEAERPR